MDIQKVTILGGIGKDGSPEKKRAVQTFLDSLFYTCFY